MKIKKFISALLVFVMILSYVPPIRFAQATENISSETIVLDEDSLGNINVDNLEHDSISLKNSSMLTESNQSKELQNTENLYLNQSDLAENNKDTQTDVQKITVLTDVVKSNNSFAQMLFPIENDLTEKSSLNVIESEPDSDQMWAAMGQYTLLSVLDYLILDVSTDNVSWSYNIDFSVEFNEPYLKALSIDSIYCVKILSDGTAQKIKSSATLNDNHLIEKLNFKLENFKDSTRIIMITSDQPTTGASGNWVEYSTYTRQSANTSAVAHTSWKIPTGVTYHCWSLDGDTQLTDFALCLNHLRVWDAYGNYAYTTTNASGVNDSSQTGEWEGFSSDLREKLILLLAYGMDRDSPYAKFGVNSGATYTAMQLVAWEWTYGKSETSITKNFDSEVQSIAEQLRTYVATNPDNIDPYASTVHLVYPTDSVWNSSLGAYVIGQPMLVLETTPKTEKQTGDLYVTKSVSGSSLLSGWLFFLYDNYNDAVAGNNNYIDTAYTDINGNAAFYGYELDKTYYVREAPVIYQINYADGWTLSDTVLPVTVSNTGWNFCGTVTNSYSTPKGSLSIKKAVTPTKFATNANLSGWVFELYTTQSNAESRTNCIKTAISNSEGLATFTDLTPGVTYYIREAAISSQNSSRSSWTISDTIKSASVVSGVITSAGTITNTAPTGSLSVQKAISPAILETNENLSGWIFELYDSKTNAQNRTNCIATATTNKSGVATFSSLEADKTYYIIEAPISDQSSGRANWQVSTEIKSKAVKLNTTTSVGTITNTAPKGSLSVKKTINPSNLSTSANLKGWVFELYGSESNAKNRTNLISTATTGTNGVAIFNNLTHGNTYYIREAPASSQSNDRAGWVLSDEIKSGVVSSGSTVSVGSLSNTAPGSLSVTKTITSAGDFTADKNNWRFELYATKNAAKAGETNYLAYAYTNSSGIATFNDLTAGKTYYVREAPSSRQDKWNTSGWKLSDVIQSGTVESGKTISIGSVNNVAPAQITGMKSILTESGTSGKLNGWIYQIATDIDFSNIVSTAASKTNGSWSTGFSLPEGTYYVREAPMSKQTRSDKNNFVLDNSIVTVTVAAGESVEAYSINNNFTNQNIEKGKIQVRKAVFGVAANSSTLKDWVFNVYSDANCTSLVTSITTGTNGLGNSVLLAPATYWIKEASQADQIRNDIHMWKIAEDIIPVTVRAGATVNAYGANNGATVTNFYGKYIRLTKVANNVQNPDCYEQIKDNSMYTLAGAQYQIIVDGAVQEIITTDESGVMISNNIYTVGTTGVIKEIVAPNGYLLDTAEHPFTIEATTDEYCEVRVSDIPTFDPNFQQFQKVDSETGVAQGGTSFEGAIFRWDYYDNTNWEGTPTRTWYFKTNVFGLYGYHPNYLANEYNNDLLYTTPLSANSYQLPLGSIKITEIISPLGYNTIPVLYATITQPAMGGQADWNYTPETLAILKDLGNGLYSGVEPENLETLGSIEVQKLDKDFNNTPLNWATLEGCEFTIYNKSNGPVKIGDFAIAQPNEACYILTVDADGKASTDCVFPIGTYEVRETKGNDFYQCNTEWSQTFTIDGSGVNPNFEIECENAMKLATINLHKVNTSNEPLAGSKFLLEYSIDGQTDWEPVFKSNDIVVGGCSNENLTEDGCLVVPTNGKISFEGLYPVIYYRITEVETPNGYQLLKDPIIIDSQTELTPDNNFETGYRVVNNESFTMPKTGVNDFWMLTPCFFFAALAMFYTTYIATLPTVQKKRKN